MSYDDLRDYFRRLQSTSRSDRSISIDWSVIRPDEITSHSPMKRMGLQIADAVASSFFYAVEPAMHGFTEPRYARMLKPIVYRRAMNYTSYGLKFVPSDCLPSFDADPRLDWVRTY